MTPLADRFWAKVNKLPDDGCWEWTGATNSKTGYGSIAIRANARAYAHRVAWELEHGRPPAAGLCVCHHCDNPRCVRPSHLFEGTYKDNTQDAMTKGRMIGWGHVARGLISNPKLTPDQVREIREAVYSGTRRVVIATTYGVSRKSIQRIVNGQTWRSVV